MDAIVSNLPRHAWLDMVNEIDRNEAVDEYTYKLVLKHPYYPTLVELGLTRPLRNVSLMAKPRTACPAMSARGRGF